MKRILLLFILFLSLPLVSAEVSITCNETLNPLKSGLTIDLKSDVPLHNAQLVVFDQAGDEQERLDIFDSRDRKVTSLNADVPYYSAWMAWSDPSAEFSRILPEQRYFFKVVVNDSQLVSGVGQTRLDLQLNETEFTRSELLTAFPAETLKFALFKDNASQEKKFVLVLDESNTVSESQKIEIASVQIQGIDEGLVSVSFDKTLKMYPNRAALAQLNLAVGLVENKKKLDELKEKLDRVSPKNRLLVRASIAVQNPRMNDLRTKYMALLSLLGKFEALNNFELEDTFFSRAKSAFLGSLSREEQIALAALSLDGAIDEDQPYVVTVKADVPEAEFERVPFTLKGKIKFRHGINETSRDLEIFVSSENAVEKFKELIGDSAKYDSVRDSIVLEAVKQNLSIDEVKELKNALDSIEEAGNPIVTPYGVLADPGVTPSFVSNPRTFVRIAEAAEDDVSNVLYVLQFEKYADFFPKNPELAADALIKMAEIPDNATFLASETLLLEKVADEFFKDPMKVANAMVEISNITNTEFGRTQRTFLELRDGAAYDSLIEYLEEKITLEQFMVNVYASEECSSFLCGPLDTYHENPTERKANLDGLSDLEVFGCLSSPLFFYTSSDKLLFDRLRSDLRSGFSVGGKKKNYVTGVFDGLKLSDDLKRDFIFRAMRRNRFFGDSESLFAESELMTATKVLIEPLSDDAFDAKYYFLLANVLDTFSKAENVRLKIFLRKKLKERSSTNSSNPRSPSRKYISRAIEFLIFNIEGNNTSRIFPTDETRIKALDEKYFFNPSKYVYAGNLQVLQVFDKKDTQGSHWGLTQDWFKSRMGDPLQGRRGELIYRKDNVTVTLFMGDDEKKNNSFIHSELRRNPNLILTFRGHSYSLAGPERTNVPFNIFRNKPGNVLLKP